MHVVLSRMYTEDPRFTAHYDQQADGLAQRLGKVTGEDRDVGHAFAREQSELMEDDRDTGNPKQGLWHAVAGHALSAGT